jgi:succinate dehydrogenase / fumarate reductase cytochrome b subunit
MAQLERPLSPFMHYRWQYSMALSFLHRASGVFLSLGFVLLVYWVVSVQQGVAAYESALVVLTSSLAKLGYFLWVLAFFYHFLNGIRHLCWDVGYGFERGTARATGWLVFISALVLGLVTFFYACSHLTVTVSGGVA